MEKIDVTRTTVIVVVMVQSRIMGVIVDAVSDVMDLPKKDIQAPPQFGESVDVSFISGIGKFSDKLVTLLDVDRILSAGEMEKTSEAAQTPAG